MQMQHLQVTSLSDAAGAHIDGIDLTKELDVETVAAIEKIWLESLVVVFRDQKLSEDDQTRFCSYFGEIDMPRASQDDINPHIMFISNVRESGKRTALEDGEMMFHTDRVFAEFPFKAATLYAIEVPSQGGNTLFANCYSALDALPAELRNRLEGRKALHVYDYENNATIKTGKISSDAPRWAHPIFRTHPSTGRKALYVNRLMTDQIIDMDPDESREILEQLFTLGEREEFVYEHVWRPGDLVMWDNRCTMHARTHFEPQHRRKMRRITVRGDLPF
jgi:taurine dioxygenase